MCVYAYTSTAKEIKGAEANWVKEGKKRGEVRLTGREQVNCEILPLSVMGGNLTYLHMYVFVCCSVGSVGVCI